jgi:hypothetical protein
MAKEPRKSNRVKEVRKKEPLKDKSQRQKANKIPLRNSANANKLYSGGGRDTEILLENILKTVLKTTLGDKLLSQEPTIFTSFENYLIEYLKKTTRSCNNYIYIKFNKYNNERYSFPLPCINNVKIDSVHKLVTEYNNNIPPLLPSAHVNDEDKQNFDFKRRVFKINLERLLKGEKQLSFDEITNMYDHDAKQRKYKKVVESYNAEKDKNEKKEIKEEDRKNEKKMKKLNEYSIISDFLKDKKTILTSSNIDKIISENLMITTIYLNDFSNFSNLIINIKSNNLNLKNTNTIILENFDDLTQLFELFDLLNSNNIKTLVLKHQARTGSKKFISISDIILLLEVIKMMTELTHFEFSNFHIDLSTEFNQDDTSIIKFFKNFKDILKKNSLENFYYFQNIFKNQNALNFFEDLEAEILAKSAYSNKIKLRFIIDYLYRFKINTYTKKYIYEEWLNWYKDGDHVTLAHEKQYINKNTYKDRDIYKIFNNNWSKDDEMKEWFKSLIKIQENDDDIYHDEYDYIDKRLYIIILHFKEKQKNLESKDYYNLIDYIRDYIVNDLCEDNDDTINKIINLFIKKTQDYRPTEGNITAKYNKMIIDYIAPPYITNQEHTTSIYWLNKIVTNGGRKINSKSLLQPKKVPIKAPKKVSKVVLKEPNTYAVIKQKIRVKSRSQIK